jgi:hypothetical protein
MSVPTSMTMALSKREVVRIRNSPKNFHMPSGPQPAIFTIRQEHPGVKGVPFRE